MKFEHKFFNLKESSETQYRWTNSILIVRYLQKEHGWNVKPECNNLENPAQEDILVLYTTYYI